MRAACVVERERERGGEGGEEEGGGEEGKRKWVGRKWVGRKRTEVGGEEVGGEEEDGSVRREKKRQRVFVRRRGDEETRKVKPHHSRSNARWCARWCCAQLGA